MKIIHLVIKKPGKRILRLINDQSKNNEVEIINLNENITDYESIIEKVMNSDRVISWGNVHSYYLN